MENMTARERAEATWAERPHVEFSAQYDDEEWEPPLLQIALVLAAVAVGVWVGWELLKAVA